MKVLAILFGVLTGCWVFYIWLGSTAQVKVYRTCYPIEVTGGLLANVTSRWDAKAGLKMEHVTMISANWCQYGVYRSIYGERHFVDSIESKNESSTVHK